MPTLYDVDRDALSGLLVGEPRYRVDQLWHGLYRERRSPEALTTLPTSLRERLAAELPPALRAVTERVSDGGDTVKWLWGLPDGATVETVLMHYPDRSTVCVSTQAGCAMGCGFCATGQSGFERHLSVGEIVEQVVEAWCRSEQATPARRVDNVVFMGMGEPLANLDRVWPAVERLHDALGLGARHLTLSTVGVVPGIRRVAAESLPVNLAVSLHAANDHLRDDLVPINRRYPLADLREALQDYRRAKNRRLSFEWALIDGVNDHATDADELARFARPLGGHVNPIPLNPTPGWPTTGSPPARVRAFRDLLGDLGVNATVRANRGTDIDAACGQLRAADEHGARGTAVELRTPH